VAAWRVSLYQPPENIARDMKIPEDKQHQVRMLPFSLSSFRQKPEHHALTTGTYSFNNILQLTSDYRY